MFLTVMRKLPGILGHVVEQINGQRAVRNLLVATEADALSVEVRALLIVQRSG